MMMMMRNGEHCREKSQEVRDKQAGRDTDRQKDRESQRHTAGRWRSLRAPGQPCDEDSGEHNPKSPWDVLIVMRRWKGRFGNGDMDGRQDRERERCNEISWCTKKRERVANEK